MPAITSQPNFALHNQALFDPQNTLPQEFYKQITDIRINLPDHALHVALHRQRRETLTNKGGRLNILACDHPARGVTKIDDTPWGGMANRHDYLARIVRVLAHDAADGVMASMDILEELLILHDVFERQGRPGFLHDKLLIPSLNRGGLAGSVWELDDPMTGPTPDACATWEMDGAKLLLRVCLTHHDSLKTLQYCIEALRALDKVGLPAFLEPLDVTPNPAGGWSVRLDTDALARLVGIASALGNSSRRLWLKLPYCGDFAQIAAATTLPILLLGGESKGKPEESLAQLANALNAAANVRGAMMGRSILYPGAHDPLAMARAVHGLVHRQYSLSEAQQVLFSTEA